MEEVDSTTPTGLLLCSHSFPSTFLSLESWFVWRGWCHITSATASWALGRGYTLCWHGTALPSAQCPKGPWNPFYMEMSSHLAPFVTNHHCCWYITTFVTTTNVPNEKQALWGNIIYGMVTSYLWSPSLPSEHAGKPSLIALLAGLEQSPVCFWGFQTYFISSIIPFFNGYIMLLLGLSYELALKQFSITRAGMITDLSIAIGRLPTGDSFHSILICIALCAHTATQLIQHYPTCCGNQMSRSVALACYCLLNALNLEVT